MTTHADHREPWHPDCATCRTGIDPLTDAEPWAVPEEPIRKNLDAAIGCGCLLLSWLLCCGLFGLGMAIGQRLVGAL